MIYLFGVVSEDTGLPKVRAYCPFLCPRIGHKPGVSHA
jgi:hypothetical protein